EAAAFIRCQGPSGGGPSWWLDDCDAEGGVVLDMDRRVLLLYGGEDLLFDVPLRRLFLRLLGHVWKGWEVRWAHEGIADLADYVGYPRSEVLTSRARVPQRFRVILSPDPESTRSLGSARFQSGVIRVYPLGTTFSYCLDCAPQLPDAVAK